MQRIKWAAGLGPRMKNAPGPALRPGGSLFAGAMIGTAIMAMAAQAVMFGAGAAIRDISLKGGS